MVIGHVMLQGAATIHRGNSRSSRQYLENAMGLKSDHDQFSGSIVSPVWTHRRCWENDLDPVAGEALCKAGGLSLGAEVQHSSTQVAQLPRVARDWGSDWYRWVGQPATKTYWDLGRFYVIQQFHVIFQLCCLHFFEQTPSLMRWHWWVGGIEG